MNTIDGPTAQRSPFDWRDLYLQALFETDRSRLGNRITEAQRALVRREHELFVETNGNAERAAVASALNALDALRSCLGLEGVAAAA